MSTHILAAFTSGNSAEGRLLFQMRKVPKKTPRFGARLKALRKTTQGKKPSYESVSEKLALSLNGHLVPKSTLWHYEHGRPPEAAVLWALATLYRQDPLGMLLELVEEWRGEEFPAEQRTAIGGVHITTEEATCLRRWQGLSDEDRAWLLDTLERMEVHPAGRSTTFHGALGAGRLVGKNRHAS
jgi:hypothetical protein